MKHTLLIAASMLSILHAAPSKYLSLQNEMKQAISRGNTWLTQQQKSEGFWDTENTPAFTALALTALVRDPALTENKELKEAPAHVKKGFDWLIAQQKEDGGIYNKGLVNYNTATSVTALVSSNNKFYEPTILKARKLLVGNQWDEGEKGKVDKANDGGIGYGSHNDRADMSNTYLAMEAIKLSQKVVDDAKHGDQPELDWAAATQFLSNCQNLKETNDAEWATEDPKDKGGFIYGPNESKIEDKTTLPNGKTPLRSYGSMSYAGLLSLVYADVKADDPRVKAVKEWLGKNYTLTENPGLGEQGLYYYYQVMAKAFAAANIDEFALADGSKVDWRKDLAEKILTLQKADGSWVNTNGRWMESNPILTTSYTVSALEAIYYSIPNR